MTANDTIKTNVVIKSIQSLSLFKFSLQAYGRVTVAVTGASHVCRQCIICHVLLIYIDSFLQINICSDNLLQRYSRNSVAMMKGAD